MLKMFIIVSVFGHVYGYAGPLEYSKWQCPYVLTVAKDKVEGVIAGGVEFEGKTVKRHDATVSCVMLAKRPAGKRLPV